MAWVTAVSSVCHSLEIQRKIKCFALSTHKKCLESTAKVNMLWTLMNRGFPRVTLDVVDGFQREVITLYQKDLWAIELIWSWLSPQMVTSGCPWHSATPMKMWCLCFYLVLRKSSPVSLLAHGAMKLLCSWTGPHIIVAPVHALVSIILECRFH